MKIKAIFFDLDGTLLPMDQDKFIQAYLGGLVKTLAPRGYDPEAIGMALWKSTGAMMKNDGSCTNEERFWQVFSSLLGESVRNEESNLQDFYAGDFQKVALVCGHTPLAKKIIDLAKKSGKRVILATSPLFPKVATDSRIRWTGLSPEDFEYVTTYENSRYCKPNPVYYIDLCEKMGLEPCDVLMVGNDVGDDMVAETVGMHTFLVTDNLINKAGVDINKFKHGSLADAIDYIKEIINE